MSILRRILLVLLALALVTLITILFLVPQTLVNLGASIEQLPSVLRVVVVVIADVIILAILYMQFRSAPRTNKAGLIVKSSGAVTDVSIESARERILKAVRSVPNVAQAAANVRAASGKADIELDVVVEGDNVNVPAKQKEIDRALRQVTTKQLGLQLAGRPRVHIDLGSAEAREPVDGPVVVAGPASATLAESPTAQPVMEEPKPKVNKETQESGGLFGWMRATPEPEDDSKSEPEAGAKDTKEEGSGLFDWMRPAPAGRRDETFVADASEDELAEDKNAKAVPDEPSYTAQPLPVDSDKNEQTAEPFDPVMLSDFVDASKQGGAKSTEESSEPGTEGLLDEEETRQSSDDEDARPTR